MSDEFAITTVAPFDKGMNSSKTDMSKDKVTTERSISFSFIPGSLTYFLSGSLQIHDEPSPLLVSLLTLMYKLYKQVTGSLYSDQVSQYCILIILLLSVSVKTVEESGN